MIRTAHRTEKPWGHELLWANATRYAGKILFIKKGHRLSRQYHSTKEETIMVLDGQLVCEEGPSKLTPEIVRHVMDPGDIFHVIPGTVHRFCAEIGDVRLVEVSTTELGDVVRLEDDYSRVEPAPLPITKQSGK
jgi:mannose-6-phosphate isomerase